MPRRLPLLVLVGVLALAGLLIFTRDAVPLERQPSPDSQEYADSANRLAHGKGYTTTVHDSDAHPPGAHPPRYPPGYPIVLAPFARFGDFPGSVELGGRAVTFAMVVALAAAAVSIGGAWAGVVAVVIAAAGTPFVRHSADILLSDSLAVLLTLALIPMLRRSTRPWLIAAGVLAGYGIVTRLSGAVVIGCLLLAVPAKRRIDVVLGAAPPVAALAVWQWATFGRPWRTGYGYWLPGLKVFGVDLVTKAPLEGDGGLSSDQARGHLSDWTCSVVHCAGGHHAISALPNWAFYPLVLSGALWIVTPPLVAVGGWIVALARWRFDAAARFAVMLPVALLVFYAFYFFQGARFMAPATYPLLAFASAGAVALVRSWTRRGGPLARSPS